MHDQVVRPEALAERSVRQRFAQHAQIRRSGDSGQHCLHSSVGYAPHAVQQPVGGKRQLVVVSIGGRFIQRKAATPPSRSLKPALGGGKSSFSPPQKSGILGGSQQQRTAKPPAIQREVADEPFHNAIFALGSMFNALL